MYTYVLIINYNAKTNIYGSTHARVKVVNIFQSCHLSVYHSARSSLVNDALDALNVFVVRV